jgi:hypothetical protein
MQLKPTLSRQEQTVGSPREKGVTPISLNRKQAPHCGVALYREGYPKTSRPTWRITRWSPLASRSHHRAIAQAEGDLDRPISVDSPNIML